MEDNFDLKSFYDNYSSNINDNNIMDAHHISPPISDSRPVQEEEGITPGSTVLLISNNVKKESTVSEQLDGNSEELDTCQDNVGTDMPLSTE